MVAAVDYPNELRKNRVFITEMVFACIVTKCFGCNNVELVVPNAYGEEVEAKLRANAVNEAGKSSDIIDDNNKTADEGDDRNERFENSENAAAAANQTSNSGLEDADEVLSDGIDEECRNIVEVMRIKGILDNHGDEKCEAVVIDSLRKLQSMTLSLETLKVTDIGKSVSPLKKKESKQIKQLARGLIADWTAKVDEWAESIEAAEGTECTPESSKPPVEEEEGGLPSPPMDEGAFFTLSAMELTKFFDDFDEDGNLQISWDFNETHEDGRQASRGNQNVPKWSNAAPTEQPRAQEAVVRKPTMAAPQERYTEKPKAQEALVKKPIMAAPLERYTEQPKAQEALVKKPIMAAPLERYTEQPKAQEALVKKPIMAAPLERYTEPPKAQEAIMKKPIMAAPQGRPTQKPKEQEARMKKPIIMAAPQGRHTEQPKEQQTVMKKPIIMAAPQGRHTEQPKELQPLMKKPIIMAAPQGRHTEQPKAQQTVMRKPIMAAPQARYTEKPKQQEAVMKAPLMVPPQDGYTEKPKAQQTVMKKPIMAAPQARYTEKPKGQESVTKAPLMVAPQDVYTEQPKQQEALAKKPSNVAAQHRCTQQPKQQEAVLKKPSNAAAQDWYTPQPKEQETVSKKPSNAAVDDWFTPQPKEQEAAVKKQTFIKPNRPSANGSGPGRLTRPTMEHNKVNGNSGVRFQLKSDNRPAVSQQNKLNCPEEMTVQERVALAKRKLQERDKAMEDAKRRRISQSVEAHNIPKPSLVPKNTQVMKLGNYSKQGTNGRQ
nr:probable mediator of RNA polymerase II transcription subunit 26B [Ipomoea batatas]